ncbi:hypothetical protein RhiJN_23400 [Ceratobasidium sp. AG-Ba]|nr:hypothetical protein RhiJN_23400 [Ceratobasidium sp. AG-Ba]
MTSSPEPMDGSVLSEEPGELAPLPNQDEDAEKAARKARRQTAIYPNTLRATPKPFSRSAAKRESVMALGSIEHLQHYFTKTGIAAKQKPSVRTKGLVPAIGGAGVRHIRAASSVTSIPELPPPTMISWRRLSARVGFRPTRHGWFAQRDPPTRESLSRLGAGYACVPRTCR